MSNTVGNNLLRQSLLSPTVLEHQSRINSSTCVRGNTFFQPQANSLIHKSPISTEFRGNRLTIQKNKLQMGKQRAVSRSTRAVLAANPSSVLTEKFNLGENIELQVDVGPPTSGSAAVVNIQVTSSSDRLILHWGAIKSQNGQWVLPHHRPVGTMVYKNKALRSPFVKVKELKEKMQNSGMPWPGDEGAQRWEQAWTAIKKVWASKWNERAYFSTRKVKLEHDYLCMAVLVQEIINADYAFVIHTTNPSSGDSSEIYAEVVKGLGETLVGAYPGRALSFICKKNDLNSPQVLGYPSKPIGLFIRRSIIFRSDSNGEDLEGYAGAGLYDR
ncbi:UNVERIFIED_CONTAM: Alpha-glucan water dikinase, chloroplastic [Sesamum radiatum]|uniref:alpha-glucan, water dikinase n=1 Tax=Sesamum radiatum TaxID=300843 RepID=A0AAW2RZG2_SESRA